MNRGPDDRDHFRAPQDTAMRLGELLQKAADAAAEIAHQATAPAGRSSTS